MTRVTRSIAVLAAMLFLVAGCRSVTGRTTGQWVDDKTTTAKVKTALASTRFGTLTRVDVDTFDGTVYLSGMVQNEGVKQELLDAARGAAQGKPVVSNLAVSGQAVGRSGETESPPAASPATTAPLSRVKFSRMDAEPGAQNRFAAYDRTGKRVATVYALPASDVREEGIADLDTGERRIEHVSIYPHPGSDGMQYHVVLWHVTREEAAALQ